MNHETMVLNTNPNRRQEESLNIREGHRFIEQDGSVIEIVDCGYQKPLSPDNEIDRMRVIRCEYVTDEYEQMRCQYEHVIKYINSGVWEPI